MLGVTRTLGRQLSTRAPQMLRIHAVRIAVILTAFLDSGGNATLAASAAMEELVISNRANLDEQCLCEFPPLPSRRCKQTGGRCSPMCYSVYVPSS